MIRMLFGTKIDFSYISVSLISLNKKCQPDSWFS